MNAHPDWLAVPRSLGRQLYDQDPRAAGYLQRLIDYAAANTRSVEGLFTSPSHPAVQEHVQQVWLDLATNYDLDGIHFDYIRFPSPEFDYSRNALERFVAWVKPRLSTRRYQELEAAWQEDPYALVDAVPEHWNVFRRDSITGLVRRIYGAVKAGRPELIVSAAVLPDRRLAREQRFQAWSAWLGDEILDVAVPMAYTTDMEQFGAWIAAARVAAGSAERLWAGVGAYQNPVAGTLQQIDHARRAGAGGVVVFAYDLAASVPPKPGAVPPLERIGRAAFGESPVVERQHAAGYRTLRRAVAPDDQDERREPVLLRHRQHSAEGGAGERSPGQHAAGGRIRADPAELRPAHARYPVPQAVATPLLRGLTLKREPDVHRLSGGVGLVALP